MIELLVFFALVGAGLFLLIALPLMLLAGLLKLVFFVILLPFRILGAVLGALGLMAVGLTKAFFVLLSVLGGLLLLGGGLLILPLAPLILLAGLIWLVARAFRPRHAVRATA